MPITISQNQSRLYFLPKGSYINIDASNGESLVENYGSGNELVTKDSTQGLMKVGPYLKEARVKISALSGSIDIDDLAYDFGKPDTSLNSVKINDFGAIGNGVNDDTDAFNSAISYLSKRGGGTLDLEVGKTYLVSGGIEPISNLTISGARSTVKLKTGASQGIFYYNSATTLTGFNLSDIILDGNNVVQNVIHITEPSPVAPDKTWSYSILTNVEIKNSGAIGLYCPIPGRIRLIGCYIHNNDTSLAWDREHIDAYGTTVESNRIGIRSTGNHFVWLHSTIAHNTEKGWTTSGAGLGTYSDVFEGAFIGCTFIDNGTNSLEGRLTKTRVIGCRFLDAGTHITNTRSCLITGNEFVGPFTYAVDMLGNSTLFNNNLVAEGVNGIRTDTAGSSQFSISNNNFNTLTGMPIEAVTPTRAQICSNILEDCTGGGIYINSATGTAAGFNVNDNKLDTITGIGIRLVAGSGDNSDWSISRNYIYRTSLEAIKIEDTTGVMYTSAIDHNTIVSANTSNTADIDAVTSAAVHRSSTIVGNRIRNEGANVGNARYAVNITGASAQDLYFEGNVARNMDGANSYVLPATGVTLGTNIGTIAP